MTPRGAKQRKLRPLNKYRQAVDLQDYFEQRVSIGYENSCWKFATKGDKDGYPQVVGSKHCKEFGLTRAHQVAYHLYHGPIPDGMIVCHVCDNPSCVNPDHLFVGTWNDNVQDMIRKGRYKHPLSNGNGFKLSSEDRVKIKELKGIKSCMEVGPLFNVSYSRICQIWRGE